MNAEIHHHDVSSPQRMLAPAQPSEQVPEVVEMELSLPGVWEMLGHLPRRIHNHLSSSQVQCPLASTTVSCHVT